MATAKSPTAAAGASASTAAAPLPKVDVPSNDIRFQIELEFIQCLASPAYLNCTSWPCVAPRPRTPNCS